jgi:hypothetical protein
MRKILQIVLLIIVMVQTAMAAEIGPSDASVKELLRAMESEKLVDATLEQVDELIQAAMKNALSGRKINPMQQKIIDDMRSKINALFKEQMKWDALEPAFVDIYRRSFSQQEIDGMLLFYKSETGRAVVTKMPVVMQHAMRFTQNLMSDLLQKIQDMQMETIELLKAADQ